MTQSMTRRGTLRLLISGAGLGLLVACSPSGPAPSVTTVPAAPAATSAVQTTAAVTA